jgi:hypothetical protein
MPTVIVAGHPWHFHSTTGKTTDRLQGITDTASRIEVTIIAIGAPMTADTSVKAIATMETIMMALGITANGSPMTGDITVSGGTLVVATVVGGIKCANPQRSPTGLKMTIRGIRRMNAPDGSFKKA